ncbi:hypothetical protein [Fastidiosibacter lacustris]|uniref:hypothetical protein n=1 Tax=Fastidiosibacter lacustris TaxID=2056695 RepID=UPI000E34C0FB|nr:hypothetical protein [Fastidiosibacter lacustris]
MNFKKLQLFIAPLSIAVITANVSYANYAQSQETPIDKNIISESLQNFSAESLSGNPESIKQLNAFYNAAKSKSYINTITKGISFADLIIKEYPIYNKDVNVTEASKQTKDAAKELYNALQNINILPIMDQHLVNYKSAFDKAWQARVAFWKNENSSEQAQDFNHFVNYMMIYGLANIQKQGMDHAKDSYVQINTMAYQLQIDAQNAYVKIKQGAIDDVYNITPEILKSNVALLRQNATVSGVTQAVVDVNNGLESALNINVPIKVFGVTIFTLKLPQSVIDFVHNAENKTGLTDSYQALMFIMKTDLTAISNYEAIAQASDKNAFAKMIVSFAQATAKHFAVTPEQGYWAILNQIAVQLNSHIH